MLCTVDQLQVGHSPGSSNLEVEKIDDDAVVKDFAGLESLSGSLNRPPVPYRMDTVDY
jgi:hypothetical protein